MSDNTNNNNNNSNHTPSSSNPNELALLAIRKRILFPGVLLRLTIGRPKSVRLVQSFWDAKNRTFKKNSLIFICTVPSTSPSLDSGPTGNSTSLKNAAQKSVKNSKGQQNSSNVSSKDASKANLTKGDQGRTDLNSTDSAEGDYDSDNTEQSESDLSVTSEASEFVNDPSNEALPSGTTSFSLETNVIPDSGPDNTNGVNGQNVNSNSNTESEQDVFYTTGTVARILQLSRVNTENKSYQFSMLVEGVERGKFVKFTQIEPFCVAEVQILNDFGSPNDTNVRALGLNIRKTAIDLLNLQNSKAMPSNANSQNAANVNVKTQELVERFERAEPVKLVDMLCSLIDATLEEKQRVLSEVDLQKRLNFALELINRQLEVLKMSDKIHSQVEGKLKNSQREYYLRQQLKAIQEELGQINKASGGDSGEKDEIEELGEQLHAAGLPTEVQTVADRDYNRLKAMQPAQPEYTVLRTYLEWLVDVPWNISTEDNLDISHARKQLEADHYGLEKVKMRIIEFLAVRALKQRHFDKMKKQEAEKSENVEGGDKVKVVKKSSDGEGNGVNSGPILCLVGPPGVGKTSLGRSIATAINRKFARLSLGGVRDEAEIRGHRRTYIGAMPGTIIQQLKKVKSNNPVILLDEVDKLGRDSRQGDPSAALLEVLDPEQNNTFTDHYLNVPFDLSKTLFIATANTIETIPGPLLDRMELIEIPSYTLQEKMQIATNHLIPKQMSRHVLNENEIKFTKQGIEYILSHYTREAGVRNLDREIAALCRHAAVKLTETSGKSKALENQALTVDEKLVETVLGPVRFENELAQRLSVPGVATGLAWTRVGGDIMFIECSVALGTGRLSITGQLGSVMEESVRAAWSFIKANVTLLGLKQLFEKFGYNAQDVIKRIDLHLHFPAGAVQKDGPSAGVAIVASILSGVSGRRIRPDTACTGEITLRGLVLPVGGIKEKVLAAHRAGIKRLVLPNRNRKDIVDIPKEVLDQMEIHYAQYIIEALAQLFEPEKTRGDIAPVDTMPHWLIDLPLHGNGRKKRWGDEEDDVNGEIIPGENPQNPTFKKKDKDEEIVMDLCGPVLASNL